MELSGSIILVTGGAHRVGKAICLALARQGAHIAFTYNSSEEAALQTAHEIESLGVKVLALRCNQVDLTQIHSVVSTIIQHFGSISGLVNSAGIMQEVQFFEVTEKDWDLTLDINTRGPFFFTQIVGKWMMENAGGVIVNIIDESAVAPNSDYVHHGISKAGLWMMTRSTALALAPKVRVNAVLPGPVLIPQGWSEERWQELAETTPLKKLGKPEDVANAVVFLMKEDFITGQVIVVDGGKTLIE